MGLMGCQEVQRLDEHDPTFKYSREEYEDMLTSEDPQAQFEVPEKYEPPRHEQVMLPELRKPVTLAVTENIPIKDVFIDMARQARVNIAVSPEVNGGVSYQAYDQPIIDAITHICAVAGLRYKIDRNTVKIEVDKPYSKTYNVQFLSATRQQKNRISMATDVFTAMEGYARDFDNGSSTLLTSDSKIDFWDELATSLSQLLNSIDGNAAATFSLHKQAGLVTVFGTQHHHDLIEQFIKDVLYSTQLQVLIEAKIIEVNLADEFKTGINWNRLKSDFVVQGPLGDLAVPGAFNRATAPVKNVFTIGSGGSTLTALASVLSRFGTVRTLSSPRVTVLNNQTAVLKVATNQVFFKVNYYREIPIDGNPGVERASSQIQTVPIGLVMVVHPTVDVDTGRITLTLRPTISRVIAEREDPAVSILSRQARTSTVPVVQVRELDSVLQMENGDTVVMGGLMEDRSDDARSGVPGVKDIPVVGHLFGGRDHKRETTELVILLRATVLQAPKVGVQDQKVYQNFTKDPRPLHFDKRPIS